MSSVLAIGAHPDDVELGCGGTIAEHIESGDNVIMIALSPCHLSVKDGFDIGREFENSMYVLGVKNHFLQNFESRTFDKQRQEILQLFIDMRNDNNFDVVYCPSLLDTHQDHRVVAEETQRAFKQTTILGYYLPWNTPHMHYDYFNAISDKNLDKKIEALSQYKSQEQRNYFDPNYIRAQASVWGMQIYVPLAEVFQCIRYVKK